MRPKVHNHLLYNKNLAISHVKPTIYIALSEVMPNYNKILPIVMPSNYVVNSLPNYNPSVHMFYPQTTLGIMSLGFQIYQYMVLGE